MYCPSDFVDVEDGTGNLLEGEWRVQTSGDTGMRRIGQVGGNRYTRSAAELRETYRDYFLSSHGEVAWQYNHVHRQGAQQ